MLHNETTCDCKHHLKKDNDSRLLLTVRTQREWQRNERSSMFDANLGIGIYKAE